MVLDGSQVHSEPSRHQRLRRKLDKLGSRHVAIQSFTVHHHTPTADGHVGQVSLKLANSNVSVLELFTSLNGMFTYTSRMLTDLMQWCTQPVKLTCEPDLQTEDDAITPDLTLACHNVLQRMVWAPRFR